MPFAPWQEGRAALPMMMRDDGWNRYTFDENTGVARFDWWWLPCCTDGLIFGPLPYVVPDDGDGKHLAWYITFTADCNDHADVHDRPANPLHRTNGNGLDGLPPGMSGLDQGMAVYQFGTPWIGSREPITRYEVPRNQLCDAYGGFQIHCGDCQSECAAHNNCGECTVDMNAHGTRTPGSACRRRRPTWEQAARRATCAIRSTNAAASPRRAAAGHFDDGSSRCIWGTADFTNVKAATVQWDPPCMCYKAAFNDKGTRAGGGDTGFSWDVAREYMGGHDPRGKLHDEVGINPVTDFNKVPVYDDLGLGKCVYVLGENQGYSNRQFVEETPTVENVFEDDPTRWHDRGTHEAACVDCAQQSSIATASRTGRTSRPGGLRQAVPRVPPVLPLHGRRPARARPARPTSFTPATPLLAQRRASCSIGLARPARSPRRWSRARTASGSALHHERAGYLNPKITDGVCTSINGGRRLQGGRAEGARARGWLLHVPAGRRPRAQRLPPVRRRPRERQGVAAVPLRARGASDGVPQARAEAAARDYWSQTGDQTCAQSDEVLGVEALYAYNPHETSYNGGLVPRDAAISYLVQDDAGDTYMVLVIDRAHDGTGGEMVLDVRFENVQQVQGQMTG